MNVISLPVIPNSPIRKNDVTNEGDFQLKSFGSFGFIQNVLFDTSIIEYDENYQNDQSNSSLFRGHMDNVYSAIKSEFPKGSKLVEVGCGKGAFLKIVKEDDYFEYAGFDAAYEGDDVNIEPRYLVEGDELEADVVILRHTLEHIQSPHKFLMSLKGIFNNDATIFIEVPQFDWIDRNKVLFDFSYEHVNYFSTKALCSLFSNIIDFGDFFGGQYQYCLAHLDSLVDGEWAEFENREKWYEFPFDEYVEEFRSSIKSLNGKKRIWVWGGATKGVLFLKHLSDFSPSIFKNIVGVVDINPEKQGLFTPCTNIEISPPSTLLESCEEGDVVLVMNPNYFDEIKVEIENGVAKSVEIMAL